MTTPIPKATIAEVVDRLTPEIIAALQPCAKDRRCLLKAGLGHWSRKPGHRFPSIKLNSRGYAVRNHLQESGK